MTYLTLQINMHNGIKYFVDICLFKCGNINYSFQNFPGNFVFDNIINSYEFLMMWKCYMHLVCHLQYFGHIKKK